MSSNLVSTQIADEAFSVTPSDSLNNNFSYLFVGTGGNLAFVPEGGSSTITLNNVPTGSFVWVRTNKVMSTNTTASQIVGFR